MNTLLRVMFVLIITVTSSHAAPFPLEFPEGAKIGNYVYEMSDQYLFAGNPGADVDDQASEGEVYVFKRTDNNTWEYRQTLHTPDGNRQDNFGYAIAYNGSELLIGAPGARYEGSYEGAVYNFHLSDDSWINVAKFGNSECSWGAQFGTSLDMYDTAIIVGAPHHAKDGKHVGLVTIMDLSGNILSKQTGSTYSNAHPMLGTSVSITGHLAFASAPGHQNDDSNDGRVFIFDQRVGGTFGDSWAMTGSIKNPETIDVEYSEFGEQLAASQATGTDLLIADSVESTIEEYAGAVYRYSLNPIANPPAWELQTTYRGNSRQDTSLGAYIAIDSGIFLFSAPGYRSDTLLEGVVFRYKSTSSTNNVHGPWGFDNLLITERVNRHRGFAGNLAISGSYYVISGIVYKRSEDSSVPLVAPGDINDNDQINLTDAILALQIMAGIAPSGTIKKVADADGDGKIGIADVLYIFRFIERLGWYSKH